MARRDLSITRLTPLSAFRVGLAFSLVGLLAWMLAVVLLYFGMDIVGIWDSVNGLVSDLGGDIVIDLGLVLAVAALIGVVAAVLMSILAPVMAFIYNGIAELVGGLRISTSDAPAASAKSSKSTQE